MKTTLKFSIILLFVMLFASGVLAATEDSSLKDVPLQFRDKHLKYNSIADMNKNANLRLGMQTFCICRQGNATPSS